jgi:hypothetical protein
LDQDVQHDAVLVDRPLRPVAFAADLQQHLVEMPFVARSCSTTAQPGRERRAELGAPLADRLVAHDDATLGEEILDVAKAEVEAKVQLHGVGDHLGWEAMAAVERHQRGGATGHRASLLAAQLDNSQRGPTSNTGIEAALTTEAATLPSTMRMTPLRPWLPMMVKLAPTCYAALAICLAGSPRTAQASPPRAECGRRRP